LGQKVDISQCNRHVRFAPNSGHLQCTSPCPFCANSGHSGVGKNPQILGLKKQDQINIGAVTGRTEKKGFWRWAIFAGREKKPLLVGSFYGMHRMQKNVQKMQSHV
jgi:hypothetical protein